jgi:DNA polymerase III subunit epsilon
VSWHKLWPWASSRKKHPSILANEGLFRLFDGDRDIDCYEFVIFDTELTGLDRRRDEIVSIAGIRIRDMRLCLDDSFHSLVRTKKKDFGEGTFVHRITPQQLRIAPPPEEVLPAFVEFCRDSVLVGHLPELDFSFLRKASRLLLGGVWSNPCLDSMELARAYWTLGRKKRLKDLPKISSFNLTELSVACRLPLFATHDALGDALQTACLFLYLVGCLKKLGITTFKGFHRMGGIR